MTGIQKFCTECGASLGPGMRFCAQCGHPVTSPAPVTPQQETPPVHVPVTGTEQITGIVPFIEQGLVSVNHYTLIVTTGRLIFCMWNPETDEAMSDAEDEAMQESCDIAETKDEIAHFQAKDWAGGPWERYRTMSPDTIAASSPGSIVIPLPGISWMDIVCEQKTSTLDNLYMEENGRQHTFDLIYSQGPLLGRILTQLLGDRIRVTDKRHRRGKLDRILSGQEYQ